MNRLQQVGVVRHDDRDLEAAHVSVVQEVGRKVHVRPFFLRLDDSRVLLALAGRHRERHRHFMAQEVPEMDGDARQRAQRPQVELLAHRLVGVVRPGADQRSEIFDFGDGVFRKQ